MSRETDQAREERSRVITDRETIVPLQPRGLNRFVIPPGPDIYHRRFHEEWLHRFTVANQQFHGDSLRSNMMYGPGRQQAGGRRIITCRRPFSPLNRNENVNRPVNDSSPTVNLRQLMQSGTARGANQEHDYFNESDHRVSNQDAELPSPRWYWSSEERRRLSSDSDVTSTSTMGSSADSSFELLGALVNDTIFPRLGAGVPEVEWGPSGLDEDSELQAGRRDHSARTLPFNVTNTGNVEQALPPPTGNVEQALPPPTGNVEQALPPPINANIELVSISDEDETSYDLDSISDYLSPDPYEVDNPDVFFFAVPYSNLPISENPSLVRDNVSGVQINNSNDRSRNRHSNWNLGPYCG